MKKRKTLLEIAREQNPDKPNKAHKTTFGEQDVEVAIAWAKGELTLAQIAATYKIKNQMQVYTYIARSFKAYYQLNTTKR